jgi:hypothetical protein
MGAITVPRANCRRRARPPLGQYLARSRKQALELMCAPKGVGPLRRSPLLLQSCNFCGCRSGGHGCRSWTPIAVGGRAGARAGGGGHAPPLWQYLSLLRKWQNMV